MPVEFSAKALAKRLRAKVAGSPRARKLAAAKKAGKKTLKGVVTSKEFGAHEAAAKKAGARNPMAYAAAVLHKKLGYKK